MNRRNQWELPLIPLPRELPPFQIPVSVPPPAVGPLPPHSYSKKVEIGGYDYQFVDKKKLPEECTCPICTLVQREAHQVICCGKIYCKSCLDELKSKSDYFKCPNCRNSLKGEHKYFPDKNIISKIRHFAIYCNNKDKGCQWEGLLKDFEEGHLPKCAYQIIGCSNNCGEANLQRQELDRHLIQVCPRRQFTCPFCKTRGEHRNITGDHITTCTDYILECPNTGCDKRIKRSQMTQHRNECPDEIVSCHHSSIGCSTMIKREELPLHHQERVSSHLDLAVKKIHELTAQANKIPVIKMQNYSRNKEQWISPGFYVSTGSYKMALKVSRIGFFHVHYLSCGLALLPGEYDDALEWPFKGEVTVELLNQKEDKDHRKTTFNYNKDTPDQHKNRVIPPKVNGEWWGHPQFILEYLLPKYLNNNSTLYFRISVKINSKTKPWLV